jgi:hypothetical protein
MKKTGVIILVLAALSLVLMGCPATVSQEDYDALEAERNSLRTERDAKIAELATLQSDLSDVEDQLDLALAALEELGEDIDSLQAEINALTITLSEAEEAAALSMPIPLSPADRSVFDHLPRTTTFMWEPSIGDGPITYRLEIQYSWEGDFTEFGSWVEGDYGSGMVITSDTQYTMDFYGAQPGRWRVKAINSCGESIWSPWQYFRYTI